MFSEHIIKSYDEELRRLDNAITQMGGLAETQLASAIEAVVKRDSRLAADVVEADARVDQLEQDIEGLALRLLALRQPMAVDLRQILAALKTASDLERIADYATNVAKRSIVLNQSPQVKPAFSIPRMGRPSHDQGRARRLCRARRRQGAPGLGARRGARRDVHEPLPRAPHLHDRGCPEHHGLYAPAFHGEEHRAHR